MKNEIISRHILKKILKIFSSNNYLKISMTVNISSLSPANFESQGYISIRLVYRHKKQTAPPTNNKDGQN